MQALQVYLATKTIVAIENAIEADQGAAFRMWLGRVLPHIADAYRGADDAFRTHMGASQLGTDCGRALWYGFRWATATRHSGRMLRLFNRGHLEEGRMIAALLSAGMEVLQQDANGKQFRISEYGGHIGGSGDGRVHGCPDAPGMVVLSEFKTHNAKSFDDLAGANWNDVVLHMRGRGPAAQFTGKGVREAKFQHYVQMQTYMKYMQLPVGLYMAVNKDTDAIYAEMVPPDQLTADNFMNRAIQIVPMHAPPPKLKNASAGWYKCRFCDHNKLCNMAGKPEINCRTCRFSRPDKDGAWYCTSPVCGNAEALSKEEQLRGCSHYEQSEAY